ncbi:hypothetical protein BC829DRAFT_270553 [Chytridium lagenaria]|nr:hypothetical protein BC829DRAFT_270553 [Chytridium lagenaria]
MLGALSRRSQQLVESIMEDVFAVVTVEMKMVMITVLDGLPAPLWGNTLATFKAILKTEDLLNPSKVAGANALLKANGPDPVGVIKEFIQTGDIPRNFFRDILLNDRWFKTVFLPHLIDRTSKDDVEARKVFYDVLKTSGRIPKKFLHLETVDDKYTGSEGMKLFLKEVAEGLEGEDAGRELGRLKKFLAGYSQPDVLCCPAEGVIGVMPLGGYVFLGTKFTQEILGIAHEVLQTLLSVHVGVSLEVWKSVVDVFGGMSTLFLAVMTRLILLCYGCEPLGKSTCVWLGRFFALLNASDVKVFVGVDGQRVGFGEGMFARFFVRKSAEHMREIVSAFLKFMDDDHGGGGTLAERLGFHIYLWG